MSAGAASLVRSTLIISLLALCSAPPLRAQSIVDGQRAQFVPSVDNATLVQSYTLNIYVSGSSTVVSTANLGKPTPDPDGYIRIAYLPLLSTPLQMGVTYQARVAANGTDSSSVSDVSNSFVLTTACGTATISPGSANAGAGASTGSIAVTSTCAYGSISNASWITVTSGASGSAGGTLQYSVAANTTSSARSGTITVAGSTFTINQAAACAYTLSGTIQSMSVDGGTGGVTVTAGAGCGWTAASNDTSWLTVTSGASGSGSGSVGFNAAANSLGTTRTGTLTIAGTTFTVIEAACGYTLSAGSQSLTADGGTGTVTVTTGSACPWTAVSNATGWLTVTSGASGPGSGTVGFSAGTYSGTTSRAGTLTVGGQTFTVNEAACAYTVSPAAISVPYLATSGTFTVTTTSACGWSDSTPVTWVALGPGKMASGTVAYSLTANNSASARSTSVIVAGTPISVTQSGAKAPGAPKNVHIKK